MHDSRLIGTWKSDPLKTAAELAARLDIPAAKKRKLRGLFGKLELRFTRTHCHSLFEEHRTINRYTVVARDSASVAIVSFNAISGAQIIHIHFEGEFYWICLGKIREYFKRKKH